MKLYKYCDENSVDILKNKRLRVSEIDKFNDPFEFKLVVETNITYETALEELANKEAVKKVYDFFRKENLCREMDYLHFREWFGQDGKKHFAAFQTAFGPAIKDVNEKLYEEMVKDYRVISLTARPDSILMWSHYGKQHQGILFKFETESIIADKGLHDEVIVEVDYSPERAKLPARLDHRGHDASRQIMMALTKTKYVDWKYEQEYRILVEFDHAENYPYMPIDARAIEEVVLGMNCDWKTEMLVKELLRNSEFSHVTLKKAKIHPDQFSLIYEPVSQV